MRKIRALWRRGLPSGLTIRSLAKSSRNKRSSRVTSSSAAISSPSPLKALDVESSEIIDLEHFVSRGAIDPVYFDRPYYLYPDGPIAVEALRVIGAAMAEAGVVGIGRLTLSRRERAVMIEPRGTGMVLFTLRAADELRASRFSSAEGELDAEMVAIAGAIIKQRNGRIRSEHVPRPLSESVARADRSEDQGAPHKAPRGSAPNTGN
jgi:DNA end-binding protein Ku